MITDNLSILDIHKLSKEQFKREQLSGNVSPNAFYLTPDTSPEGDIEFNWKQNSFTPEPGQIVIYNKEISHPSQAEREILKRDYLIPYARMKIGDTYGHSLDELQFESLSNDIHIGYESPKDDMPKIWFNPNTNIGFKNIVNDKNFNILNYILGAQTNINCTRYNSIEDALLDNNATDDGPILAYTHNNILNIILLDNITITSQIVINKNCTITLNSYTITMEQGAEIYIDGAPKVIIDGSVEGSTIIKNTNSTELMERLVYINRSQCFVNGGTYKIYGSYVNAVPFYVDSDGTLTIENINIIGEAESSSTSYGIHNKGSLIVNNCFIELSGINSQAVAINNAAAGKSAIIKNSTINVRAQLFLVIGIAANTPKASIEHCYIKVVASNDNMNCYGIYSSASSGEVALSVKHCHVIADGSTNGVDSAGNVDDKSATAIYSYTATQLSIYGGYYWGAREGLSIHGALNVNGGIYEGCNHGGMYLSGENIKIKNAIIRSVPYTGECDWYGETSGDTSNYYAGALYCGSSNKTRNIQIYLNNCRIETLGSSNGSIVAKYYSTKVYMSNIKITGNTGSQLRADATCTIYVGKNVMSEMPGHNGQYTTTTVNGGTIDTTSYAAYEFIDETSTENEEIIIPNSTLAFKNEAGHWIPISGNSNNITESRIIELIQAYLPSNGDEVNY